MGWLILILLAVIAFVAAVSWLLVVTIRERTDFRAAERTLGEFEFTEEEWQHIYQAEFVDDKRARNLLDPYTGAIIYGTGDAGSPKRRIVFSDQNIGLFGDTKHKIFRIRNSNFAVNSIQPQMIRVLDLQPLKKLQVKLTSNIAQHGIVHDLEYLIPLPKSAHDRLAEIEREYGELVMRSTS
ncbi:MAG: hypothetical protein WKF92_11530 [Pyrinomonadaceae bacterium]